MPLFVKLKYTVSNLIFFFLFFKFLMITSIMFIAPIINYTFHDLYTSVSLTCGQKILRCWQQTISFVVHCDKYKYLPISFLIKHCSLDLIQSVCSVTYGRVKVMCRCLHRKSKSEAGVDASSGSLIFWANFFSLYTLHYESG